MWKCVFQMQSCCILQAESLPVLSFCQDAWVLVWVIKYFQMTETKHDKIKGYKRTEIITGVISNRSFSCLCEALGFALPDRDGVNFDAQTVSCCPDPASTQLWRHRARGWGPTANCSSCPGTGMLLHLPPIRDVVTSPHSLLPLGERLCCHSPCLLTWKQASPVCSEARITLFSLN